MKFYAKNYLSGGLYPSFPYFWLFVSRLRWNLLLVTTNS